MSKVSIIVPSCNEIAVTNEGVNVLQRTVQDIYEKATGDFEVIVGFNGPEYQEFPDYPNLRVVKMPENIGLKTFVNVLAIMAKGKYIYKSDAHCSFSKGFDEVLQADMQDNWIVTPRFYVLNGKTWEWQDDRHYDYFYLSCPFTDNRGFRFKAGGHWPERTAERDRPGMEIDETPQFHGSGWFMDRDFFLNKIGGFSSLDPMGHAQEPPFFGLKTWLGPWDGKVMVNKKCWYAHMHQDGADKGYHYTREQERTSYDIWAKYFMGDKWEGRVHNIDWFIEKFMPMPTWPKDWKDLLQQYQTTGDFIRKDWEF
jgi:glycosyltransferase involved in cell wall biosynthesis